MHFPHRNRAEMGGDFSQTLSAAGQPLIIYDPVTTAPSAAGGYVRTPFPGNRIPQNRIDPVATNFLTRYEPLPNGAGGNYRDATPNDNPSDSVSARVDHQFGNRSSLTGRYTLNGERNLVSGSFPLLPFDEQVRAQQAWQPPQVSPEGLAQFGEDYWNDFLEEPALIFVEARR